jgi:TPR repeat protein
MYYKGERVPQDYAEAAKWFHQAATQGQAGAQFQLAWMYDDGRGIPQDYVKALKWYRKAATQGDPWAQINLGAMYDKGRGVPQDYVQAHRWYNLAASHLPSGEDRDIAVKNRDIVAARMTAAQIAEAQRLAREWQAVPNYSFYTGCARASYDPGSKSSQYL